MRVDPDRLTYWQYAALIAEWNEIHSTADDREPLPDFKVFGRVFARGSVH